jgi:hypothetical protein
MCKSLGVCVQRRIGADDSKDSYQDCGELHVSKKGVEVVFVSAGDPNNSL